MQTVADLYQDHTDIVAHRQQQLLEVLCLCRGLFTKDTTTDLRQSIDDLCDLITEDVGDVLHGVVGVLHHVVEQGGADTGRAQSDLRTGDLCDGDGVHDIRFTRQTAHAFVGLFGEVEGLGDQIDLLAMARCQIAVQECLKRPVDQLLIRLFRV